MSADHKKKSITFVSPLGLPLLLNPPGSGAGGAERQFFLFGKGLSSRGWSVCFVTDGGSSKNELNTVMRAEVASFSFMGGSKWRLPGDWISLLCAMWRSDSYFYVLKTPAYLLVPMSIFTRLFGRKLVFWAQTDFDAYPELRPKSGITGYLMDKGIERSDIILAQSASQIAGFKKNFSKEAKLIKSISGSLSVDDVCGNEAKSVDILWVGNSTKNKRQEVFLLLAKMMPEYKFALAMNNADPARFVEAGEMCKTIGNVDFLGEVKPGEMESWFGRSRLLLNTSVREGFPNTFIQAWQHGLPVVSLCIDPDDLLGRMNLGFVLDKSLKGQSKNDLEEYANKLQPVIKLLLTDRKVYEDCSNSALRYVQDNHGEKMLVERLESLLCE